MTETAIPYQRASFKPATFFDRTSGFRTGHVDPLQYLERCIDVIAQREATVKAWVVLNEDGARKAAKESAQRWRAGAPLSAIDGMPIGIKDLIETKDMPTQMGCAAFDGNFPKRDSALVRALRDAGAVILGKTVTTALGFLDPGPTANPFDQRRTPGGSSSGSGAAVGAGMVPVAIGTQLVGSVIRPASYCANWALKPTFGALNRGERLGFSQGHIGVHAGSPVDMWQVAIEIAKRAGGDPGHPALYGATDVPLALKPQRLIVVETEAWPRLDEQSSNAFEGLLDLLGRHGVSIVRRRGSPLVEHFERSISCGTELSLNICAWEQRWSLENLAEQHSGTLGPQLQAQLERARRSTLDRYRLHLLERKEARERLVSLESEGDALISLSSTGPAPFTATARQTSFPTGDVAFSCVSSLLGNPAVNVPVLSSGGMPLGVQLLGQQHGDQKTLAIARWIQGLVQEGAQERNDG